MKFSTKLLAGAAVALSLGAVASSVSAATVVIADFAKNGNTNNNFDFVNKGGANASVFSIASAGANVPGGASVKFSFDNQSDVAGFTDILATFNFAATVTNTPAFSSGGTFTQSGIDGSFSFVYAGADNVTIDGHLLRNALNNHTTLFSGNFTNAWIQGKGGVGGIDVTIANNGSATFASGIADVVPDFVPHTDEYTLTLATVSPNFGAANASTGCDPLGANCLHHGTTTLKSFKSFASGDFQAGAIPEPATWGLMLVGFGGMGAMLRNRRRMAAVAA